MPSETLRAMIRDDRMLELHDTVLEICDVMPAFLMRAVNGGEA